jgi:two-component system, probable response regulator PhcQ
MQNLYDYKKFAILYVDDEEKSLKYFRLAFDDQFRVLTAPDAQEGYRLLEQHKDDIAILITDQRMPGEKGVQLLEKARQLRPRIIRMLATAYSDLDAAVGAINTGAIYKYIHKPWDVPSLELTLKRALEFFMVQRERDQLLREKMSALQNMMITDRVVSLGLLAAGLGHHIRNSLVAIRTFLDLAPAKLIEENVDLEELRNPNYWKEFYDHVQSQVRKITEMLTDLGAATDRPESVFKDRVDIHAIVAETTQRFKDPLQARNLAVENKVPTDLPALVVDEPKFRRLFDLLLRDELANLPPGSHIRFSGRVIPNTAGKPVEIQIEMEDDGSGLPAESLRSVFNPFFVRKDDPQEFGINLMACYFIVYHHGGRIEVSNRNGKGSLFTMTFAVDPQAHSSIGEDREFVSKVLMNETLWEKLLAGGP